MFDKEIKFTLDGGFECELPKMTQVKQHFERNKLNDIPKAINESLSRYPNPERLNGMSLAITVGSRGISGSSPYYKKLLRFLNIMVQTHSSSHQWAVTALPMLRVRL